MGEAAETLGAVFVPLPGVRGVTLPHLSSQVFTGAGPLLTHGHACPHALLHGEEGVLPQLQRAQLPLNIPA